MESESHKDDYKVSIPCESACDTNACCKASDATKSDDLGRDSFSVPYVYRQDVVKHKSRGMVGIVTEVAGDSDSESSVTDDDDDDEEEEEEEEEEEGGDAGVSENGGDAGVNSNKDDGNTRNYPLPADQVRVLWLDDSEAIQSLADISVIDRGFLHGDYVAATSDPTGQVGVVMDVNITVDLLAPNGSVIRDVSSKDLKRVRDFAVGDYVVLGPWLGRVDDVLDNVTVLFDDGSICKVMKADPLRLRPVAKDIIEDGHFPYYPGQRVRASSSSIFKNSRWLSGLWKASRCEGTVTNVTVGSVFIYWIASAGYGPDSSTAPAEEQLPKNLKILSCFSYANWQLGDWCLLPPPTLSSASGSLHKGLSKLLLHDFTKDELDSNQLEDSWGKPKDLDGSKETNDRNFSSESSSYSSTSPAVSKEPVRETWALRRNKIRKVVVKREKKIRKKEENFERALMIVGTRTKVDVAWQDGTVIRGLDSTTLIPIDSPGDHEFVAEQYVIEKAADDNDNANEVRRVGVVKSVNAKEKTAAVRWLKPVARAEDPREFDQEELVSVYELEGHPDYDYCYGDVVVRLSPVSASPEKDVKWGLKKCLDYTKDEDESGAEAFMEFSDLSWVGNITGLRNGDIEVTWADGMVSTVGPQAVFVVGRDDDDESISGGSEVSDDAASWETMCDDELDALENPNQINLEAEDTTIFEEGNSGRNGALSIPLAALGFVTRLATGIFSRGRKNSDPSYSDLSNKDNENEEENELQSQGISNINGKEVSVDESNSRKSISTTTHEKDDQVNLKEAKDVLDVAEALCDLIQNHKEVHPHNATACSNDDTWSFKRFDIAKDPWDHHFLCSNRQNNNSRKWLRKVQQDWSILQNNLPDGIYVRVYEDRMDLLRAVIVGAHGTPYQDGLFFFDFHLPPEYPDVPPSAYYHSGGWRINPNLYEEGKVCLSLLNTWTGKGNEVWEPQSSSILQVLVSLQGLVLNSKPYFNEAGYDKQIGTGEGEKNSISYNENTFLLNCKTMMYLMRKPPKDFEELVKDHFRRRGYHILKACDAYMRGYLIASLADDASVSHQARDENSTSVGFKLMLRKIMPKLLLALSEVGVDCCEFEHLQHSQ